MIELDQSHAKVYSRKGVARSFLEEYHMAMAAFKAGSSLDVNDTNSIPRCQSQSFSPGTYVKSTLFHYTSSN